MTGDGTLTLRHGRISLVLHRMADGTGTPLLLVHGWRREAGVWRERRIGWPGPVYAIDLAGHGRSDRLRGGAYAMELFAADADVALAELGTAAVAGEGSGAYVALLLAGARPDAVPGVLLLPGPGLEGGGAEPDFEHPVPPWRPPSGAQGPPDPWLPDAPRDVRPPDYAACFGGAASAVVLAEDGGPHPPWWRAVAALEGAEAGDPGNAFARLAARVARRG